MREARRSGLATLLLLALALSVRAEAVEIRVEGGADVRAVLVRETEFDRVGLWTGLLDARARLVGEGSVRASETGVLSVDLEGADGALLLIGAVDRASTLIDPTRVRAVGLTPAVQVGGTLVDAAGEPVEGARVLWLQEPPGNLLVPPERPLLGWTTTTDAKGKWSIEGVATGPAVVVVHAEERGVLVRDNAWTQTEPMALSLPVPARVTGTVRSETTGEPAAGATVRLIPGDDGPLLDEFVTPTDDEGVWTLEGLPAARFTLVAETSDAFLVEPRSVVVRAGDEREKLDVSLRSWARLTGRVGTVATDPVAGAEIYLIYPRADEAVGEIPDPWTPVATTDAKGSFSVDRLPPQAGVTVVVRHPAHATRRLARVIDLSGGVTAELPPVLLDPGRAVVGTVVETEGEEEVAVAGVAVAVVPADEDARSVYASGRSIGSRRGTTDAEGAFRIGGLAPGRYRLVARTRMSRLSIGDAFDVAGEETTAKLTLVAGSSVFGVVATSDRGVVEGATVRALDASGIELATAVSADDGSFALTGLEAGEVEVVVEARRYLPARVPGVVTGRHLRVTLEALGRIEGAVRVKDALEGDEEPLPGFTIGVHRWVGGDELGRVEADRLEPVWFGRAPAGDGSFAIPDLPPGRFRVEVELADGRSGAVDGVEVAAGKTTEGVRVEVAPGGTITGRVFDAETGRPIEGASVRLIARGFDADTARLVASTDETGTFRMENVPEGRRTLEFRAADHAPQRVEGVEVLDGLIERIEDVTLGIGARVEIEAIAPGGGPLIGASFTIDDAARGLKRSGTTDLDGHLVFDGLASGGHRIEGAGGSWTLALETDEIRTLRVDLAAAARVEGLVTRAGRPVPGLRVEAYSASLDARTDRHVVRAMTGEDGTYELTGLEPGRWIVRVGRPGPGAVSVRRPIVVTGAEVPRADFELPDGGLEGTLVDDYGDPVFGGILLLRRARGGEVGRTTSDRDGAFSFAPLSTGTYRIEAYSSGHGSATSEPIDVAGEGGDASAVRLKLTRAGAVIGRIEALRDRRPLADGWLVVRTVADRPATLRDRIRVNQRGEFRIDSLAPGRYLIHAEAPGHGRATEAPVDVAEGGETRISFLLEEEARLEVRVFGPGGRPLRSVEIEVRDLFGRRVWPIERSAFGPADLDRVERLDWLTDGAGIVRIRNLGPGLHLVHARRRGFDEEVGRIVIQASADNRLGIVLTPPKR